MKLTCPDCGKRLTVRDDRAGKKAKCPSCGQPIRIPMPTEIIPASRTELVERRSHQYAFQPSQPVHVAVPVHVNVQASRANSLGISSLVLGIVAFLICWIPFFGLLGLPLSVIGLVLGVIAFVVALARGGTGIGYAIGGSATCGLAAFVTIGMTMAIFGVAGATAVEIDNAVQALGTGDEGWKDIQTQAPLRQEAPITYSKYEAVQNGMSYGQVVEILGESGTEMSRNRIEGVPGVMPSVETVMFSWQNPDGSNMNAIFQNDKLVQKAQFGLPLGEPTTAAKSPSATRAATPEKPTAATPTELVTSPEAEVETAGAEAKQAEPVQAAPAEPVEPEAVEPEVDPEVVAAHRLRLAKKLLDRGVKSSAKTWLKEIIGKYPDTAAAKEARELVDGL